MFGQKTFTIFITICAAYQSVQGAAPDINIAECIDQPNNNCASLVPTDTTAAKAYCTPNCETGTNVLNKAQCCETCGTRLKYIKSGPKAWNTGSSTPGDPPDAEINAWKQWPQKNCAYLTHILSASQLNDYCLAAVDKLANKKADCVADSAATTAQNYLKAVCGGVCNPK